MIKQKRIERGLTQEQLANMAGVTKNYVTMLERGARKGVSFLVRVQLAEALEIPPLLVVTAEEAERLQLLERALSLEGAEAVAWQLHRCLKDGSTPTGSKAGAAVAIRVVAKAYPERRKEMAALRGRLNELSWT